MSYLPFPRIFLHGCGGLEENSHELEPYFTSQPFCCLDCTSNETTTPGGACHSDPRPLCFSCLPTISY